MEAVLAAGDRLGAEALLRDHIAELQMDYAQIIEKAWAAYDASRAIRHIQDISVMVSTNHVFRITFQDGDIIIAKLSYFGKYEHFKEDHRIIHSLGNNLLYPFENLLAKSLLKNNKVFTFRYRVAGIDAWVVFYNPVRVLNKPPARLSEHQIRQLARQMAKFHLACSRARAVLPRSSKTPKTDIYVLLRSLRAKKQLPWTDAQIEAIRHHCHLFLEQRKIHKSNTFEPIPVFIDWNIGNFSVSQSMRLYSRWDYDWFRMSTRMMDFYFLSRLVSDRGDQTVFSYVVDTLMEDRFMIFLEEYHKGYPLSAAELRFLPEAYRFFILNYVIKDGNFFFSGNYARRLQQEAFEWYLPSIETGFDVHKIFRTLNM